jgi:hypothetical protein
MRDIVWITFLILILLLFQYCSNSEPPYVCTNEFVTYTITVLEPNGEPADSVEIEVTNKQTGKEYDICEDFSCRGINSGTYTIMHDGFFGELSETKEIVLVEGTKDDLHFSKDYAFRSGPCHVEKLAGPDTVSLSSDQ